MIPFRPHTALALAVFWVGGTAFASNSDPPISGEDSALFGSAVQALNRGAYNEAVEQFESLADRGFAHPDASYDRALAHLGRLRAGAEKPGDLGQAAAALEETLRARPSDGDAEHALELVRSEVARRRSRGGGPTEIEARPSLQRAIFGLVSEGTWATLCLLSSLILCAGLALRHARQEVPRVMGAVARPVASACLLLFAALTYGAGSTRSAAHDGIIVVSEARLLDERGIAGAAPAIPEAARVEIVERRGALVLVRWGSVSGFIPSTAVRPLLAG